MIKAILFAIACLFAMPSQSQVLRADAALVLLVDVSGSVAEANYELQKEGLARAFASNSVKYAIAQKAYGIAVTLVEFSSDARVIIPWTLLGHDQLKTAAFAARISAMERSSNGMTYIGVGLLKALEILESCPYETEAKVIDVSGDGTDNYSGSPTIGDIRARVLQAGTVINGLPILVGSDAEILENYYRERVAGGSGSFVIPATSFSDFYQAMRIKLANEISMAR